MSFHPDNNLPDCMMPDGGHCCTGHVALVEDWRRQQREIERLCGLAPCPDLGSKEKDAFALANALERADWSNVSIGNKIMISGAIDIIREFVTLYTLSDRASPDTSTDRASK